MVAQIDVRGRFGTILADPRAWGFAYKSNVVWFKVRKDGGADGRGVGFHFRNVIELLLFGVRGGLRTLTPGRSQVNLLATRKQEHSRKPDEAYRLIEACSPGPYRELFARERRAGGEALGDEVDTYALRKRQRSVATRAQVEDPLAVHEAGDRS